MEEDWRWEQNTLINELTQGMDVAIKLKAELRKPYSADTRDLMVQRILSSYEKALLILRWNAPNSKLQNMNQAMTALLPESPISVSGGSPLSEDVDGANKDSKKRKIMPKWVDQVRVSSESGLEGRQDDGYNWRKYGQKDILGAKYPRSYYRCTFRNTQGCWATKQVQRSDEDPSIFDITYKGKHTCSQGNNVVLPPKSPEKHEKKQCHNNDSQQAQPSQESLTDFGSIVTVNSDNLGNEEMQYPFTFPTSSFGYMKQENHSLLPPALENDSFLTSLFQTHLSTPNTHGLNYIRSPSFQMNELDAIYNMPATEYDLNDILSTRHQATNTSATNSPIPDLDFSLEQVDIDLNFHFNTPGFFS